MLKSKKLFYKYKPQFIDVSSGKKTVCLGIARSLIINSKEKND